MQVAQTTTLHLREWNDWPLQARRVADLVRADDAVLITGKAGSGARRLAQHIQSELERSSEIELIHYSELSTTTAHQNKSPYVVHGYKAEYVSQETIDLIATHMRQGCGMVLVSESDQVSNLLVSQLHALRARECSTFHHIHIGDLNTHQMEALLHTHPTISAPDIVTVQAIVQLAEGRSGWLEELLWLSTAKHIEGGPFPAFQQGPLPPLPLPEIDAICAQFSDLSPEVISTAVVLSKLNPLSYTSMASLFSRNPIDELIQRSVLYSIQNTDAWTVPVFIGEALRTVCPIVELSRVSQITAHHILTQESMGFPLVGKDANFCVNNVDPSLIQRSPDSAVLRDSLSGLLTRTLATQLQFESVEKCRSMVFHFAQLNANPGILCKARVLLRAGQFESARNLLLEYLPTCEQEETFEVLYLLAYTSRYLGATPRIEEELGDDKLRSYYSLLVTWHQHPFVLDSNVPAYPENRIRGAHQLFLVLEQAWAGVQPDPDVLTASNGILNANQSAYEGIPRELLNSELVASALLAFIAGELMQHIPSLERLLSRIPDSEHHAVWFRHLLETDTALKHSDLERATEECSRFAKTVPNLLTLNVQDKIDTLLLALNLLSSGDDESQLLELAEEHFVVQLLLYVAVQHDTLKKTINKVPLPEHHLKILQLIRLHFSAQADKNPSLMLKVGEKLWQRGFIAMSFALFTEARTIFISRRSTARVSACDKFLERIRQHVSTNKRYTLPSALDSVRNVQLNPRELASAQLAAEGLSNKQIAEKLQLNQRTVESHIAQARAKLGAETRRDLARVLPSSEPNHRSGSNDYPKSKTLSR